MVQYIISYHVPNVNKEDWQKQKGEICEQFSKSLSLHFLLFKEKWINFVSEYIMYHEYLCF